MRRRIERFEDILAWQESRDLVIGIYRLFRNYRDYAFRDQIQRAAISIMNNIAEGYERKGNKELAKFLYIAKGSSAEVRSMLYIALNLKYVSEENFNIYFQKTEKISKMLSNFIKRLA